MTYIDAEQLACERAAIGALVAGRLTPHDLARDDVPDLLTCAHHRRIVAVLLACYEARAAGGRVPGAPGVDLRFALRACEASGVYPVGGLVAWQDGARRGVDAVGYLPTLAREAPKRPGALEALEDLRRFALDRYEAEQNRTRARGSLSNLVPASLFALSAEDFDATIAEARRRWAPRGPDLLDWPRPEPVKATEPDSEKSTAA